MTISTGFPDRGMDMFDIFVDRTRLALTEDSFAA